ncbi:hypothetical protein [uncultured Blautia sp.]|uniref:hypothetical protein n=1 Tax=uncultured Blautia sp. TaxID=765821 RepID=UPI00280C10EE|nr:hypothetical protein [uncultured Blautia sp.]
MNGSAPWEQFFSCRSRFGKSMVSSPGMIVVFGIAALPVMRKRLLHMKENTGIG